MSRTAARIAPLLIVACLANSGCAASDPPTAGTSTTAPSGTTATPIGDFFSELRPPAAAGLVRDPDTLKQCTALAQMVVEARPVTVTAGRSIADLQLLDITLGEVTVLAGTPNPATGSDVHVELPGVFKPDPIEGMVARLNAKIPSSRSVWFLKWNGAATPTKPGATGVDPTANPKTYSLVHPNCGVFTESSGRVEAATAGLHDTSTARPRSARAEAEEFLSLNELIAAVKAAG